MHSGVERAYLARADHVSLSQNVRCLSELANFVFTNHYVGCRERKKNGKKKKKKEKKTLIGKPECSKQRNGEKKLCFYIIFKRRKTKPGEKKGAGIY